MSSWNLALHGYNPTDHQRHCGKDLELIPRHRPGLWKICPPVAAGLACQLWFSLVASQVIWQSRCAVGVWGHTGTISGWERGERNSHKYTLQKLKKETYFFNNKLYSQDKLIICGMSYPESPVICWKHDFKLISSLQEAIWSDAPIPHCKQTPCGMLVLKICSGLDEVPS